MVRKLSIALIVLLTATITLSGCTLLSRLAPGGVRMSDAEWSGVTSGPALSLTAQVAEQANPQVSNAIAVLSLFGLTDPLGVLLPVKIPGETQPRYILCTEDYVAKCSAIPVNTTVHFAGTAIGPGLLWKPSRLTSG